MNDIKKIGFDWNYIEFNSISRVQDYESIHVSGSSYSILDLAKEKSVEYKL